MGEYLVTVPVTSYATFLIGAESCQEAAKLVEAGEGEFRYPYHMFNAIEIVFCSPGYWVHEVR